MNEKEYISPLEKMMASAKDNTAENIAVKVMGEATKHVTTQFPPAPGSMPATAMSSGQILCSKCNALVRMGAKFCQNCGSPVSTTACK